MNVGSSRMKSKQQKSPLCWRGSKVRFCMESDLNHDCVKKHASWWSTIVLGLLHNRNVFLSPIF